MGTEDRATLPIAPANSVGSPRVRFSHSSGSESPGAPIQPVKDKPKSLTVSRQWVLPQRPKPGRKPKPKPAAPPAKTSPDAHARNDVHVASPTHANSKTSEARSNDPQKPGHAPNGVRKDSTKDGGHGNGGHGNGGHGNGGHGNGGHGKAHHDDDSCGLCARDDCMCETIGLKSSSPAVPERKPSLPTLDMILNNAPAKMDAVPLKRPHPGSEPPEPSAVRKYARSDTLRPVHPKHVLHVPSPLEGLQVTTDSCGFCTENSFCACSEAEKVASSPLPPPPIPPSPAGLHAFVMPPIQTTAPSHPYRPIQPQPQPHHHHAHPHAHQPLHSGFPQQITTPPAENACQSCEKDAMSMLFCLSLGYSSPLVDGAVSIPCYLAFRTLQKHPRFEGCDLGRLVRRLEVSPSKQVGVQSINRVLQDLERGEFSG